MLGMALFQERMGEKARPYRVGLTWVARSRHAPRLPVATPLHTPMNRDEAIAILGKAYQPDGSIQQGSPWADWHPKSRFRSDTIELDGGFTADELEAMAVVMRAAK